MCTWNAFSTADTGPRHLHIHRIARPADHRESIGHRKLHHRVILRLARPKLRCKLASASETCETAGCSGHRPRSKTSPAPPDRPAATRYSGSSSDSEASRPTRCASPVRTASRTCRVIIDCACAPSEITDMHTTSVSPGKPDLRIVTSPIGIAVFFCSWNCAQSWPSPRRLSTRISITFGCSR